MNRVIYRLALMGVIVGVALAPVSTAVADIYDNPPPQAGFTHSPAYLGDSPQRHGILLSGAVVGRSSPVIANISNNSAGNEVVVAGSDGIVYVFPKTGGPTPLWQTNVFSGPRTPGCAPAAGDFRMNSSPAVGDIDDDGVPEVVIGYGTIQPSNCDGGVVALNGNSGAVEWYFSLREWEIAEQYPEPEALHGVVSSPGLADVEGDGLLEIGFGGLDRNLYLLNSNGTPRFYYHAADTVWSSPAFANVDGDAALEMIIGTDITGNAAIPVADGGFMYAFDTHQRAPNALRLEFNVASGWLWRRHFEQVIYSSPALGDVLASNPGDEIVVGSGCWFPGNSTNKVGKWVKILRLSDGAELATLNAPACLRSSPGLGDIDDDGKLEVVAVVTGATEYGGNSKSRVIAWDPEVPGGNAKWTFTPVEANAPAGAANDNDPHGDDLQSPIIADLDGNGSLEVTVSNMWTVHVLRGATGAPLTCQSNACGNALSLWAWWTLKSTPTVGDLDGDGDLEVVIGGGHLYGPGGAGARGMLYAWTNLAAAGLGSPNGTQPRYSAPWPIFRGSYLRAGAPVPYLATSHGVLPIFQAVGTAGTLEAAFQVINTGGGTLDWSSTTTGGINLTPNSGSTRTQATVALTVNVGAAGSGATPLGTITINSSNGLNAPIVITVWRFVGPMVFLPQLQR